MTHRRRVAFPLHPTLLAAISTAAGLVATASGQCPSVVLWEPEQQPEAHFGGSVSLRDTRLVIGATNSGPSGAAYVWDLSEKGWVYSGKLLLPWVLSSTLKFGASVAQSADLIFVGEPGLTWNDAWPGAVHVFQSTPQGWTYADLLFPAAPEVNDYFGTSIAIDHGRLVIGADCDDDLGYCAGSVYIFESGHAGWEIQQQLFPPEPGNGRFGSAIAIKDDVLVVGAGADDDLGSNSGKAYVFVHLGESWRFAQTIFPDPDFFQGGLGNAVAVHDDGLLVSEKHFVRWLRRQGTIWIEEQVIAPPEPGMLVRGLAADDDRCVILYNWPVCAVHKRVDETWVPELLLDAPEGSGIALSGRSVALRGDLVLIGDEHESGVEIDAGAVFVSPLTGLDTDGDGAFDQCDNCSLPNPDQADCDGDGFGDLCILAFAQDSDCDGNGVPDSCDVAVADCNGNLVPDSCDVASGASDDCNGNGLPDECDAAIVDCNGNGVPDDCDIVSGAALDCDGNGVLDGCDLLLLGDCDGDGVPDSCELARGSLDDCNGNGVPDSCEAGLASMTYQIDDGTQETSIGLTSGGHFVWLNALTVVEGGELVVAVEVAWGTLPVGSLVDIAIWTDPFDDGVPSDAVLKTAVYGVLSGPPGSPVPSIISVPATWVGVPGERFFVGVHRVSGTFSGEYPAALDTTQPQSLSWYASTDDLSNLGQDSHPQLIDDYLPGNWMVRAVTTGAADGDGDGVPDDCETCPEDLDSDGLVDGSDLGALLAGWGSASAADLDGSGVVDSADLGLLLAAWGACR